MNGKKHFLKSKINWTAFCIIALAILQFAESYNTEGLTNVHAWVTFSIGILIVFFRTFMTTKEIGNAR